MSERSEPAPGGRNAVTDALGDRLEGSPYQGYLYSYPHKTAYRTLEPSERLDELWAQERKDALFLYLHVPACEQRCGFCNLFTTSRPDEGFAPMYLSALERQARVVRDALGPRTFARVAVGGGTPTLLEASELERLLDVAESIMGASLRDVPVSVETSPETATVDRLALLAARGIDRISIGVQSFVDEEVRAIGRRQSSDVVAAALDRIRSAGFATLNVDLMYGLPGQDGASWDASLSAALRYAPEELYLYPLYVRPLTGLGRSAKRWDDERLALYRAGRARLLADGYEQVSLRMFRRARTADGPEPPFYACQDDGMVGLGCGARSYTQRLHYADDYAVGATDVRDILRSWMTKSDADFAVATRGFPLDDDDRRRRWVILSLLAEGIDLAAYRARFAADVLSHLPELTQLETHGLARVAGGRLVLTERGIERSDVIGPWLISERARALMDGWVPR